MARGYSSREAMSIVGISYRQLDHWDREGFVQPSIRAASGRGSRRLYDFKDLVKLKAVRALRQAGVSLSKIKKSLAYLNSNEPQFKEPLSEVHFVTDGKGVFMYTGDPLVYVNASQDGQLVWSLNLTSLVRELLEKGVGIHESNERVSSPVAASAPVR